ncbi:hypothetical protein [Thermoleptolyngbya sp.]
MPQLCIQQRCSADIISLVAILQADLVLSGTDAFDVAKFQRRQRLTIPNRGELYFASPEDLLLSKLQWRRSSQSEKQWRDILGILKTQAEHLERVYLRAWATWLGVGAALEQAFQEPGVRE